MIESINPATEEVLATFDRSKQRAEKWRSLAKATFLCGTMSETLAAIADSTFAGLVMRLLQPERRNK
jgi:hypothetical protein